MAATRLDPVIEPPPAAAVPTLLPVDWTAADLQQHLGGIPLARIRMVPPPGTATEEDVLTAKSRIGRICELIDGVLVEKAMGYYESRLAIVLAHLLEAFLDRHNLGIVLGEAGTLKVLPRQVRIPDVCFIRWEKFPNRELPRSPIPALAPDLAVEILSEGNTEGEMQRKLRDYFAADVRMVWYIDPPTRTARVFTAPEQCLLVDQEGTLQGGDVLPGLVAATGGLAS